MTILPKKHKPPPPSGPAGVVLDGGPGASSAGGGAAGDRDRRGEDATAATSEDHHRLQPHQGGGGGAAETGGGGGAGGGGAVVGWGPAAFEGPVSTGPPQVTWSAAPGSGSGTPVWASSGGGASGGVASVGCSAAGAGMSGGGVVGASGSPEKRPAPPSSLSAYGFDDDDEECQPTASKRRHRTLGKRLKSSGGVSSAVKGVAAALSRPTVTPSPPLQGCSNWDSGNSDGAGGGGYNSEDEYSHLGLNLTPEEWEAKDRKFEKMIRKKGYHIKHMVDDGSCLFRAVADQVFGDQEMHGAVREHCMNYIEQNSDYFSQYITEDMDTYVTRKRYHGVHGNHLEIQALSEMYSRPIHIYSYGTEPINIFQTFHKSDIVNVPIRLSYHREVHYNSLVDPYKPTIGVGLGLPGYSPGSADRNLLKSAVKASEESLVEKAMLEDKLKHTDWEATNDVIEEQVARESYQQWLRDNERRHAQERKKQQVSSTVTSGELKAKAKAAKAAKAAAAAVVAAAAGTAASPKACCSKYMGSPRQAKTPPGSSPDHRGSPQPGSSSQQSSSSSATLGLGDDFRLNETESFLNNLPPDLFGLEDWGERDAVLAQVLAASQQEYFDSLKKQHASSKQLEPSSQPPPSSSSPASSPPSPQS